LRIAGIPLAALLVASGWLPLQDSAEPIANLRLEISENGENKSRSSGYGVG